MKDLIDFLLVAIPVLPLLGAIAVALLGAKWLKEQSHYPIVAAIGCSFVCSLLLLSQVASRQKTPATAFPAGVAAAGYEHITTLWTWVEIPDAYRLDSSIAADSGSKNVRIDVSLRADALTATMLCMVTFVATLVTLFAAGYMHGEPGYWRFFSYVGLFVFSMTMLVSVSNFVLLFVFWEAVGVCSYLLIGYWYHKPEAATAGMKAFLVNRVGDFGFALALFLIWTNYGTLNFHDSLSDGTSDSAVVQAASNGGAAANENDEKSPTLVRGVLGRSRILAGDYVTGTVATVICLLLMLGACGKSAQFPLHVWLPDAMEGPTPVSALIHAATMVTAGVYMVTRCTPLFMVSPDAQLTVAIIGSITALLAGLIALTQHDLKRVLAYSTVSQLGFMFLGLGTGTFVGITSGMFHLFTHAFFKALLFLGSGSVMHAMGHIIDMRKFSGLRKLLPQTHATFLLGCMALAGVFPFAGFWSKDAILGSLHDKAHALSHASHAHEGAAHDAPMKVEAALSQLPHLSEAQAALHGRIYQTIYYLALFTAFLTAFYTFRAFFLTFWGEERIPEEAGHHAHESPQIMTIPLWVLAIFAVMIGGAFMHDQLRGNYFAEFLGNTPSLAAGAIHETIAPGKFHLDVAFLSTFIALLGIIAAMYLYAGDRSEAEAAQRIFDLRDARRFSDVQWVAALKRNAWIAKLEAAMRAIGLGPVVTVIGLLLNFIALLLSIPLTIGTFVTPYRLSLGKFFFDELYLWSIVRPLELIARIAAILDRVLIDGLVNLCGTIPKACGGFFRSLQTGQIQFYAAAMTLGAIVLMAARVLFAGG